MGTEMPYCQGQHRLQLRSEQLAVCATNKAPSFQRVNTGNKVYVGPRCSGAHLPLPLLVHLSHVGAGRPWRLRPLEALEVAASLGELTLSGRAKIYRSRSSCELD